jgi:hypothetical protein
MMGGYFFLNRFRGLMPNRVLGYYIKAVDTCLYMVVLKKKEENRIIVFPSKDVADKKENKTNNIFLPCFQGCFNKNNKSNYTAI